MTAVGKTSSVEQARALIDAAKLRSQKEAERRGRDRERDMGLILQVRNGDQRAFAQLVEHHQHRLYAVAVGMMKDRDEALDVVQDAFIRAYKKLPEFEGNAAFSTWMYRIVVNLCIDRKRAETRRRKADVDDTVVDQIDGEALLGSIDVTAHLSGTNPLRNADNAQLRTAIASGLATLSDEHRAALLLREVDGLSYEEIAEALDVPKGTVMSRLFHARKNMQKALRPFLGLAEGDGLSGPEKSAPEKNGADEQATPMPRRNHT